MRRRLERLGMMIAFVLFLVFVALYTYENSPVSVGFGEQYVCCDCGKIFKDETVIVMVPRRIAKNPTELTQYLEKLKTSRAQYQKGGEPLFRGLRQIHKEKPCPACTVAVRVGERLVCPDCGQVTDNTQVIYVAKSRAGRY